MKIREPQRQIEVLDEVDVLVAGAGVSGCAAAVAAARAGAKTMLIERNGVLGGVATAGLMGNIVNDYMNRDGRMIVNGIAREVVDKMVARGAASPQWSDRDMPGVVINSEQLKVLLIEMQQQAGVKVLTHALATQPITDGNTVKGVFIESKSGRQAVLAKVVIDTTGEADIAGQTGCPLRFEMGTASREFKMANVNLDALYHHFKQHPRTFPTGKDFVRGFDVFERNWLDRGVFFFPHGGGLQWDIFLKAIESGEYQREQGILYDLHATGMYGLRGQDVVIINSNFWRGEKNLDVLELSLAEMETQKICYYVADFFRKRVPGFEKAYIVQIASDMGIRYSRGIEGKATFTHKEDYSKQPVYFDDTIGCRPAHCRFEETGEFYASHTVDIPYRVMVPKNTENLLVASGKSVSCQPLGVLRFMPSCMMLGQGAGVAGALAAKNGALVSQVDIRELQRTLLEQDVFLGSDDRLKSLKLQ